ncbi:MAG: hypothetical protein GQ470_05305 [Gammaproteobacteria bacterium]|nr:hypothetical protein [Gammaproteobacteria bacterium]
MLKKIFSRKKKAPDHSKRSVPVPGLADKINHLSRYPWVVASHGFVKLHSNTENKDAPFEVRSYDKVFSIIDEQKIEYELDDQLNKRLKESSINKVPLSSLMLRNNQSKMIMNPVANLSLHVFGRDHSDVDHVRVKFFEKFKKANIAKVNELLKNEMRMTIDEQEMVKKIVAFLKQDGEEMTVRRFLRSLYDIHYFPAILFQPKFDLSDGLPIVGVEAKQEIFHKPEYREILLKYLEE